jgi:hypothetical protein
VEGAIKADALAQRGVQVLAIAGVDNWHAKGTTRLIADLRNVLRRGQFDRVVIAYDADAIANEQVAKAQLKFANALSAHPFCTPVSFLHLHEVEQAAEDPHLGVDDFLAAGRTIDELRALVREEPPSKASVARAKARIAF